MPQGSFSAFLIAVSHLAEHDAGPNGKAAVTYLEAFSRRREIVATSRAKYEVLSRFAPLIKQAAGSLLFTQTVKAANHAINRLDPLLNIEIITGETSRGERERILHELRVGTIDAVAAPRVLDEGIDVPNANLGIVISASRTRRQMIQRMGRILRRKPLGSGARFVILFASDTLEDPRTDERDGFMEEIQDVAESSRIFGAGDHERLTSFLDYSGPEVLTSPKKIGPMSSLEAIPAQSNLVERYAWLNFLAWHERTKDHAEAWDFDLGDGAAPPYLEFQTPELPALGVERVSKSKAALLSTGEQPVTLIKRSEGFALQCTGCGAMSEPTRFRWKALDATVECSCLW